LNTSLHVEADTTAVTPGTAVPVPVRVRNTGDATMQVLVRIVGVEDSWTDPPLMVGPLAPGEETAVEFPIRIPVGFPPCEHLAGVEAEPIDPSTGAPLGRAVFVEVVLEIGDGSVVRADLEPADIYGGGRGKFRVNLRNRGRHPINIKLTGESPGDALSVHFEEDEVVLPPGEFVNVRAKVKGSRPMIGPDRRLPFVVTMRSRGTPRHLDGSFTQSPTLKSGVMKVFAIIALVALWGSLLVVSLGRINPPKKSTTTQAAAAQSSSESDSANSDGSGGGGGGDSAGAGGSSDGGAGSTAAAAPTGAKEIKVGGKVKGADPAGAKVSIQPTSLVDENAQGATFVNDSPAAALTKHYGHTGVTAPSLVASTRTTTTDEDGAWSFAGIKAPGYYLVIISKAGFATKKYVVSAPEDGSPIVLDSDLVAGDGTLAGGITSADGPLGGVDLTISDGTVTLKTVTPTTGDIGKWAVTGLTTPGTYLITANRRGFGTETKLVDLPAGGSVIDADIEMKAGVGSVTGTITSNPLNVPVGGVNVTISDGTTDRSATTLTVGQPGTYSIPQLPLPNLPLPTNYTLTVSGPGWITQTAKVDLVGNAVVDLPLTASSGQISGTVTDKLTHAPLDSVGIIISNEQLTLKTTSAKQQGSGTYIQDSVPPGTYKVTFGKFGYGIESAVVDVAAGGLVPLDMELTSRPSTALEPHGKVSISVVDTEQQPLSTTVRPVQAVQVTMIDQDGPHTPVDVVAAGNVLFDNVIPGIVQFKVTATHYKTTTIPVQVPPDPNVTVSGIAVLPRNAVVTGVVVDIHNVPIIDESLVVTATTTETPARTETAQLVRDEGSNLLTGHYVFDGTLDEGEWNLVASATGYSPSAPRGRFVLSAQTFTEDLQLNRLGFVEVLIQTPNNAGALVELPGVTVSLSGGPTPKPSVVTTSGAVVFANLQPGTYTISPAYLPGGYVSDPVSATVTVSNDAPARTAMVMLPRPPTPAALEGNVMSDLNGVATAVPGAQVSVNGISGYNFQVTAEAPFFAFTAVHSTRGPALTNSVGRFVLDTSTLKFSRGDIVVTAPSGYVSTTLIDQLIYGPHADISLVSLPSSVTGTVSLTSSATVADSPSTVTAQVTSPSGTGVTVQVHNDGTIQINDPRVSGGGANTIRPGTYTIAFSLSGYDGDTETFTVAPGGTANITPVLVKHGALSVSAICGVALRTSSPFTRVTITRGAFTRTLVGSSPLVFNDLQVGTYTVTSAKAAGCGDPVTALPSPVVAPGLTTATPIALTKLGTISGYVRSKINSTIPDVNSQALPGVTITATGTGGNNVPFSAITGQDGFFNFEGSLANNLNGTGDHTGLLADTYTLVLTAPGYTIPTVTPITLALGEDNDDTLIIVVAQPATVTGTLTDFVTNAPIAGVSVSISTSQVDHSVTPISTGANGVFTFSGLEPVQWIINFSAPGYFPLSVTVGLPSGNTLTDNEKLTPRFNAVTGIGKTKFGSATAQAEAGITVNARRVGDLTNTIVSSDTTDANGNFLLDELRDGSYFVDFIKTGFDTFTAAQVTLNEGTTLDIGSSTINATPVQVTVTVLSQVADLPIVGTTVTLTPQAGERAPVADAPVHLTVGGGAAVFTQVTPSAYDITITPVGGHRTVLDDSTVAVPLGGPAVNETHRVQEARLKGLVQVKDGQVPPSTNIEPAFPFTVQILPLPIVFSTVPVTFNTDTDSNGNYARFVPPNGHGYNLEFFIDGGEYEGVTVDTGAIAAGADVVTNAVIKKLSEVTLTVQDSSAAHANASDVTVTVQDTTDNDSQVTQISCDSPCVLQFLPPEKQLRIITFKHHNATFDINGALISPAFNEGKTTLVTFHPGDGNTLSVRMTTPPS
jgi:hypothetical protein